MDDIEWPITNEKMAKLLDRKEATVRGYLSRFKNEINKGEDYVLANLGIKNSPSLHTLWTKKGAIKLATYCNSRKAKVFLEKVGHAKRVRSSAESVTLDIIEASLSGLAVCEKQYYFNPYKIDMYLPEFRIAIECDEFEHKERNSFDEELRQEYLEEKLSCVFIRYNPNQSNFNLGKVINRVLMIVLKER